MDTDDDEYTPQATITSSSSSKPPKKRQRKATSSPALAPSELAKLLSKTVPGPTGNISKPAVDKLASALSNAAGYSKSAPPRASIVHMLSSALKRLSELSSSHFQAQLRELCSAEAQTPCFVAKSGVALVPDTVFEVLSYLPASDRVNLSAVSKDCKSFVDSPLAWDELRLQTSTKDALRHFFSRGWAVQRFCLVKRVDLGNMSMSTELWPLVFRYMPLLEQINMTNLRGAARHNAGYLLDAVTNPDRITSLILPTGLSEYAAYWGTFTKLEAVKMNWYSSCIERGGAPTLDRLFAQPTLRKFTAYMFIYNSNGDHRSYSISALSRAPNLEELSLTNVFGLSPEDWQRFAAQGKLWKLSLTASTDEKNLRVMAADKERGPLYDVDAILANRALTHLTIVRARDARWELLVGEGGLEKLLEWSEGGGNTFSAGAMDVVTRAQLVSIMAKVKKGRVWIRSEGKKELLEYKAK